MSANERARSVRATITADSRLAGEATRTATHSAERPAGPNADRRLMVRLTGPDRYEADQDHDRGTSSATSGSLACAHAHDGTYSHLGQAGRTDGSAQTTATSGLCLRALLIDAHLPVPLTFIIEDLTSCLSNDELKTLLCDLPRSVNVETLGRLFEGQRPLHRAMLKLAVILLAGEQSAQV